MNRKFSKTAVYLLIFSWALLPCAALAQPAGEDLQAQEGPAVSDIAGELGLTAEQKEGLKEQRYETQLKRMELQNKIKIRELQLRHELERQEVNRESINKIVAELKDLQGQVLEQKVDSVLEMKKILTPEQAEKLRSLGGQRMRKRAQEEKGGFFGRMKERFSGMGNKAPQRDRQ